MDTNMQPKQTKSNRYDVFLGRRNGDGTVTKIKTIGSSTKPEGHACYTVFINTFLQEVFYLLPNKAEYSDAAYSIATRQVALRSGRRLIWRPVGEARAVDAEKQVLELTFDLFPSAGIYMSLAPRKDTFEICAREQLVDSEKVPA